MNLAGIVIPGDRVPAVPGKQVLYRNGILHSEQEPDTISSEKIPAVTLPPMPPTTPTPPAPRLFQENSPERLQAPPSKDA